MLSIKEIQELIPHRYPFLLIDAVLELEPGKRAVAVKNVSINEPFFQGHFPGHPIMPGVLIVEALAQTASVCMAAMGDNKGKLGVFAGIDGMKFKKSVFPGDVLRLEVEVLSMKMGIVKAKVTATVDGKVAAEGEIKAALVDVNK